MTKGVGDGFSHVAFGEVTAFDFLKVAPDESQARGAVTGSHGFAKGGAGLTLSKTLFDLVEVLEEVDDAGGVSFSGIEGFDKVAPDVGEAASEVDEFGMIFLVAGVDGVAIDLENAGPGAEVLSEGLLKVLATTTILPPVADAAAGAWVVEDPNVSAAGLSSTGSEFFDGAFVDLEVALVEAIPVDRFGNRSQELEALQRPVV